MKRTITTLALALPLALAACGGGSGDPAEHLQQGSQALGSGDAGSAVDHFGKALAGLPTDDPRVEQATLGQVEAKIELDAEAAKTQFLAYAEERGDQLAAVEYVKIGSKLSAKGALAEATAVLGAGLVRHPGDAKLDEALKATQKKAEEAGDEGALDALKGLGYTG